MKAKISFTYDNKEYEYTFTDKDVWFSGYGESIRWCVVFNENELSFSISGLVNCDNGKGYAYVELNDVNVVAFAKNGTPCKVCGVYMDLVENYPQWGYIKKTRTENGEWSERRDSCIADHYYSADDAFKAIRKVALKSEESLGYMLGNTQLHIDRPNKVITLLANGTEFRWEVVKC